MWIKLLQRQNMSQMMQANCVNGTWRKPMIQGRQKAILRNYFEMAGVPWIYDKERPEVHVKSTYNRKPKGTKFENNYETKLALVRKNLLMQPEKFAKL